MTLHGQIERSQTISGKRIRAALKDYSAWLIPFDDTFDYGLENTLIVVITDTISKRYIDSVSVGSQAVQSAKRKQKVSHLPFTFANSVISYFTSTREKFTILVKTARHDPVGRVEGFFHAIPVVDVNIDVQNTLMIPSRNRY